MPEQRCVSKDRPTACLDGTAVGVLLGPQMSKETAARGTEGSKLNRKENSGSEGANC
jgi:hypothetical protein